MFMDCNCDKNFLRQELSYINHVRDQALADIQLFINNISTGGGGENYNLNFIGKNDFKEINHELTYQTQPMMTRDEIRKGLARKISMGLVPYLAETELGDQIEISIPKRSLEQPETTLVEDPWNFWIFEISGEGEIENETSRKETDWELAFEADHVTEDWRIRTDIRFNYAQSRFQQDDEAFLSKRSRHFGDGSLVRSLSEQWSAGVFGGISHNTYRNLDLSYYFRPAVEYNIFPYREVLRREITFAYKIGMLYNNYIDETIYGEDAEYLFNHSLDVRLRYRQPWGDISASLEASTFLHDFSKNSLEFSGWTSVRILKGLAIRVSANMDIIRDQLSLPAGDASLEDLLLRQRQIATDFEMGLGVGISYTFGSAFNNIINTRL